MEKTRQAAYDNGEKFYMSSKPCRRNHQGKRYTSTGNCVECMELGYSSQTKRNTSRKLTKIPGMLNHPHTYVRNVELRAHEALDLTRDIFMLGSEADRDELFAYLHAKRNSMSQEFYDRPPINKYGHLSYLDFLKFGRIEAGRLANWADFDYGSAAPDTQSDDMMYMGGYWYQTRDVVALINKQVTGIRPSEAGPLTAPVTMKGIIT